MPKYTFHDGSSFQLGELFNPLEPFTSKPNLGIIDWEGAATNTAIPSGGNIVFKYDQITKQEEYYNALSIDMALEAKWGLIKGKSSLNFSNKLSIDNKSFALIFTVEKIYNPEVKSGTLVLGETGKNILERAISAHDIASLPLLTGTEIVQSIKKGSQISVIYHVESSSESSKRALQAHLGAKWNFGSASFNFSQEMLSIDKGASLKIEIRHMGANLDSNKLAEIIKFPDNLTRVKNAIVENLNSSMYNHASIVEVNTVYFHENITDFILPIAYPERGPEILSAYKNFVEKIKLGDNFNLKLYSYLVLVEKYFELALNIRDNRYQGMKPNAHSKINEYIHYLESIYDKINEKYTISYKEINDALSTQINEIIDFSPITPINLSFYLEMPQVSFIKWDNSHFIEVNRRSNTEFYDVHAFVSIIIATRNIDLVKSVEIYRDGQMSGFLNSEQLIAIQRNNGDTIKFWHQDYKEDKVYGWGWECHHCPAIRNRVRDQSQPNYEANHLYTVTAYLIDGSEQSISIGNLKNPSKSYAENLRINFLGEILSFSTNPTLLEEDEEEIEIKKDSFEKESLLSNNMSISERKYPRMFHFSSVTDEIKNSGEVILKNNYPLKERGRAKSI